VLLIGSGVPRDVASAGVAAGGKVALLARMETTAAEHLGRGDQAGAVADTQQCDAPSAFHRTRTRPLGLLPSEYTELSPVG
jgi:hypothetical protein